MATAIAHALKPTRSRVLTLVTILAILFGCYGLLSAQQARSAPGPARNVWGGVRNNGTLVHGKHVTSVSHPSTGHYMITFDRNVDTCSLQTTSRYEGGSNGPSHFQLRTNAALNQVVIEETNAAATSVTDGDFDVLGMCPSS